MATAKDGKGVYALAAKSQTSTELEVWEVGRPPIGPTDVRIDIHYCGMCHSDVHAGTGDWNWVSWPIAPGHEIAGLVKDVGADVSGLKKGDPVGVGVLVESCRKCKLCRQSLEPYCPEAIFTYGSKFPDGKGDNFATCVDVQTSGGYSTEIVVNENFVFLLPKAMKLEYAGVLLCAGITMFSPLHRHLLHPHGTGEGKHVGIVGFGGLGQLGTKLAKAMGCQVTILSRSDAKREQAKALGANYMVHTDPKSLEDAHRTFDLVLDTVSADHDVAALMNTLDVGGTYVLIGLVNEPMKIPSSQMEMNLQTLQGSIIGGLEETAKMLEFCTDHGVVPDYKVIHARDASKQYRAMLNGTSDTVRYVIDMKTIQDLL